MTMLKKLSRTRQLKRLLMWVEMLASFVTLTGIILVSIELLKLQAQVFNASTYVGFCLVGSGKIIVYTLFTYTALVFKECPTAPIVVCSNCIHVMIGASLIIVVHVLPVRTMFAFLKHYSSVPKTDEIREYNMDTIDLENMIWLRVTILGSSLMGVGAFGAIATLTAACRLYAKKKKKEQREIEIRRKVSRSFQPSLRCRSDSWKIQKLSQQGSVYDYTAWGNRGKDLYKEKSKYEEENVENGKTKTSMLNRSGLTTNFTMTSPFESATALIKSARKFAGSLSPQTETRRHQAHRSSVELSFISDNRLLVNHRRESADTLMANSESMATQGNLAEEEFYTPQSPNKRKMTTSNVPINVVSHLE